MQQNTRKRPESAFGVFNLTWYFIGSGANEIEE